jgi:hypothetical protein
VSVWLPLSCVDRITEVAGNGYDGFVLTSPLAIS